MLYVKGEQSIPPFQGLWFEGGVYLGLRPLGAGSSLGYNIAGLWP